MPPLQLKKAVQQQLGQEQDIGAYLGEEAGLPAELSRNGAGDVASQQCFGVHLIIHMHSHVSLVARPHGQLMYQGRLARACIRIRCSNHKARCTILHPRIQVVCAEWNVQRAV